MATNELIKLYKWENRKAIEEHPPHGKRIRATMVDFDSPDIASSQESSVEPMDILASQITPEKTHGPLLLSTQKLTWLNRLVLLARAAVTFRAKHGKFPWRLPQDLFYLVH